MHSLGSEVVEMFQWIECPCCASQEILEDEEAFKKVIVIRNAKVIERSISKYYCFKCHCEFKGTIERKG